MADWLLAAVLSGFLVSLAAPWSARGASAVIGWTSALLPVALSIYFAALIGPIAENGPLVVSYPWAPVLGIHLSFYLDGLSLMFALLISGIGALVMIYAASYLAGHPHIGRFYAYLLIFMASMLGLVLADNVMVLFVFWELTTLSSYLLIGFDHERETARAAALQALLVTAAGGLALLAGLILLAHTGASYELSVLLSRGQGVRAHSLYLTIFLLILAGAFTKSAQFPFHFWLPAAMEAPTPVSAYLHSATMVKAGIYLLARLNPVLGDTEAWHYAVTTVGAATMLIGAAWALIQTDLKRILAYSTVSALGTLTLLLGLGTTPATKAAMVFLFVHSLYKGALFLAAGAVDHEAGTRDVERLRGLGKAMPVTAIIVGLAALSMAGLPPLFGFISKELLYEAKLQAPAAAWLITGAGVLANMLLVAVAALVLIRPFFGKERATPKRAHEPPWPLLLGPGLLAGMGLVIGLFPDAVATPLVEPAVAAVRAEPTEIKLALWHGFNPIFALSMITLAGGAGAYAGRTALCRLAARFKFLARWGPAQGYLRTIDGIYALAYGQTRVLQSGYLRVYLLVIVITALGLVGFTLASRGGLPRLEIGSDTRLYEWAIAAVTLGAAIMAAWCPSRLGAVAALGTVGYGVGLIFIVFGAPDLAMTQFVVESLTVILFVLVFYHLPHFTQLSPRGTVVRDAVIALLAGSVMMLLVLLAVGSQLHPRISDYFGEHALALAHGRNIVNVILVDFRSLDTLGEITVLGIAALGVYALLKFPQNRREEEPE